MAARRRTGRAAGVAAACRGHRPPAARIGAAGHRGGAALLGPAVATYTAALIADTAVPAWHDGYREMPFVFAGSSATAAGGSVWSPRRSSQSAAGTSTRVRRRGGELVAVTTMKRQTGMVAEPYHQGRAGRLMQLGQGLTAAGLTLAARRSPAPVPLDRAGALLAAASAVTRFGIFEAGKQSVADPRYVVDPQRAR